MSHAGDGDDGDGDARGGGGGAAAAAAGGGGKTVERAYTCGEALRTSAFWATSLGCWCIAATGTAFWARVACRAVFFARFSVVLGRRVARRPFFRHLRRPCSLAEEGG